MKRKYRGSELKQNKANRFFLGKSVLAVEKRQTETDICFKGR